MPIEEKSTGLLVNYANKIDALRCPGEGVRVAGDQYDGGFASGSSQPDTVIFDKTFEQHDLEGYFAVRLFYDTNPITDYQTWVATLEVYENGVLKVWDSGNQDEGKIKLILVDQVQTLGCRVMLWFNPKKSYRIIVRTAPTISGFSVNLDYIQFTQVHHGNMFLNWINASETIGGDLQVVDHIWGTLSAPNPVTTLKTGLLASYPFKEMFNIIGTVDDHPELGVSVDTTAYEGNYPSGVYVPIIVGRGDGASWSGTLTVRVTVVGTVELPMVRPL